MVYISAADWGPVFPWRDMASAPSPMTCDVRGQRRPGFVRAWPYSKSVDFTAWAMRQLLELQASFQDFGGFAANGVIFCKYRPSAYESHQRRGSFAGAYSIHLEVYTPHRSRSREKSARSAWSSRKYAPASGELRAGAPAWRSAARFNSDRG